MKEERSKQEEMRTPDDLRLLNAFGEALGDLPSEEETERAWQAFAQARRGAAKRRRRIQLWTGMTVVAAAVVALLFLWWGWPRPEAVPVQQSSFIEVYAAIESPREVVTDESHGRKILTTPPATTVKATLDDGTEVLLSANSRLEYPEHFSSTGRREVRLIGEARFTVAHDESRPFVVISGDMQTQVLGTVFDVNAYPGSHAEVTLYQGHVRVREEKKRQEYDVTPGQQAVLAHQKGLTVSEANLAETGSWVKGLFNYDDATLVQVMRAVGTWYNKSVIFHSAELLDCRVHFRFPRTVPLTEVVQALNDLGIARLELQNDCVIINER